MTNPPDNTSGVINETDTFEKRRDAWISAEWPKKGPCLVPHKSAVTTDSMLLSCHENDFCLCEVRAAADWGYAQGKSWNIKMVNDANNKYKELKIGWDNQIKYIGNLKEKLRIATEARDAYATAMAIALREGIIADNKSINEQITEALAKLLPTEETIPKIK